MLRNYLTTARRNLLRNRLYAAINIAGLAVGFAAALFIALFVRDEFSYDRWIPGHDRVFRISTSIATPDGHTSDFDTTPGEVAGWLKLDFPSVEQAARLSHRIDVALRRGDQENYEKLQWADPSFFEVVPLPVLHGDLKTALTRQNGLVITRRIAMKYFGRDDVVGQTLEFNRVITLEVTAVLEDLPTNTHFATEVIASGRAPYSSLTRLDANPQPPDDIVVSAYVYFRLAPGARAEELKSALPEFLARHKAPDVARQVSLVMMPVADIHLHPTQTFSLKVGGDPTTAYAMLVVGILIVAIGGINFVNLMTARATRRAVEVGVRKVSGAARRALIVQFIGEALLYVGLSMVAALIAVALIMPSFNAFLDRVFAFDLWRDPALFGGVLGLTVVIGVLAGAYPAFVLSAVKPAAILGSGRIEASGGARLRQGLVLMQFAMLMGLIISTLVVRLQTDYAMNQALRIDKDQVLTVQGRCDWPFRDAVAAIAGVKAAACSSADALGLDNWSAPIQRAGGTQVIARRMPVDIGFFELYGLTPSAGRFFSAAYGRDIVSDAPAPLGPSLVINETAVRALGFASPEEAVGQFVAQNFFYGRGQREMQEAQIVGVVPDFVIGSTREAIDPTAYFVAPKEFAILSVKLDGRRLPEALAGIDLAWKGLGTNRPIQRAFLDQYVQSLYVDVVRQSRLFEVFSGIALFTACLGLFGMAAFTAEQRTKEIGIRKAMGATKRDILRLLLWQFTKPVLWANVIAWPAAYFIMQRWLEGFAYHIDLAPWMFLAASALAVAIAMLTVIGHALLVARAKPVAALRYE